MARTHERVADRLGVVEDYMLARVVPEPGRQITCSAVFADYREWCADTSAVPLREAAFIASFETVARASGIRLRQRGGNLSFMDMGLSGARPSA